MEFARDKIREARGGGGSVGTCALERGGVELAMSTV